jgi:23S rRNA (uracil1939-C5)-methyltransferase
MAPEQVQIEKLVHGGQALGTLSDGRKVLVWNALPGETVEVELQKSRHSFAEGTAMQIIKASPQRVEPHDHAYLSTSPWQIMDFSVEGQAKQDILLETFEREGVKLSSDIAVSLDCVTDGTQWHYRNKMEYSFWGDKAGLHLALFHRASHGKRIVTGSSIARPEIDEAANHICAVLNSAGIRGSQLKTVVVRCNMVGNVIAALYVKDEAFPELAALAALVGEAVQGIEVFFSNPKSPASVYTKTLYSYGDQQLREQILGKTISYDVRSFFQVNVPVFVKALEEIKSHINERPITDFYCGVGTIGIPLEAEVFVESDTANVSQLRANLDKNERSIIEAPAEAALEHIPREGTLIVDPPRAGLHAKVTEQLIEKQPSTIVYLSCNPITQARDLARMQDVYGLETLTVYNFFPRTPHIESLAVLRRKS